MNQITPISEPTGTELLSELGLPTRGMAPGLAILFSDQLYKRVRSIAKDMSEATGLMPPHLINQPAACLAVITRSITWKLDPWMVAASTYATPGGRVGYEGKLVQAILEQSGRLEGPVRYEMLGDWSRIRGKFKEATSAKGHKYQVPAWTERDEEGLGVKVSAQVLGEATPREEIVYLRECWPRNSTLWALRPHQQIKYTACRTFANTCAPTLLMGIPFDHDSMDDMRDVTPQRPSRSDFASFDAAPQPAAKQDVTDLPEIAVEGAAEAQEAEANENPMPEFGPADAMEMGREARKKGASRKATPPEWRDEHGAPLIEAWLAGWDEQDEEIKTKLKA